MFVTTNRLIDTKYGLIKGKLHQTIGVINLNEMKNWNKMKNPRMVKPKLLGTGR